MSHDILNKDRELAKQSARLSNLVTKSTDSLDSVLNDRILELEEQLLKVNSTHIELKTKHESSLRENRKVMSTLQGLLAL